MSDKTTHTRRKLEEAGWEREETDDGTLWINPEDGHPYEEQQALEIIRGGDMAPD
jgi:hypothetical protein